MIILRGEGDAPLARSLDVPSPGEASGAGPTSRPWSAERDVDAELARALIGSRYASLAAARVEPFGQGWDNTAFLVDGAIVFRFPRKQSAAALLATEARVLPSLGPRLPLPIPRPEWIAEPGQDFPWPFVGYRLLPGEPATAAALTAEERAAAAEPLGTFLRALHDLPTNDYAVPGDLLARDDFARRKPLVDERLRMLEERGTIDDVAPFAAVFREKAAPPPVSRLVHGDLYASHLLFDERRCIAGVIDWGDVHRGDPAMDLMMMFAFLPPNARGAFELAYGRIDDRTRCVARMRAVFHSISLTWYGVELGNDALEREGRTALDYVLRE
jgi:aminoglycoside phosphotransferase (APT) family kinase protein